jgi:hypothetical protein
MDFLLCHFEEGDAAKSIQLIGRDDITPNINFVILTTLTSVL